MTDPAVQAVAEALCQPHGEHYTRYIDPDPSQRPRALATAQVAVDAYRRAVLASRPDAERWARFGRVLDAAANVGSEVRVFGVAVRDLLSALADETAARQAAEADRDRLAAASQLVADSLKKTRDACLAAGQYVPPWVPLVLGQLDGSP